MVTWSVHIAIYIVSHGQMEVFYRIGPSNRIFFIYLTIAYLSSISRRQRKSASRTCHVAYGVLKKMMTTPKLKMKMRLKIKTMMMLRLKWRDLFQETATISTLTTSEGTGRNQMFTLPRKHRWQLRSKTSGWWFGRMNHRWALIFYRGLATV